MTIAPEASPPTPSRREDFAELSRMVRDGGLFARPTHFYPVRITVLLLAFVLLGTAVVVVGNSWWSVAVAVGLAFVLGQVAFVGHDAGHRQVWARRRGNDAIGLVLADLVSGFSFGWWLSKHGRHHGHTNQDGRDPDIAAGALVYTPRQTADRGRFGRRFARTQSVAVVPLLFLEALNLHVASVRDLVRRRDRGVPVEAALLSLHALLFFVAPFLVLGPVKAVVFIVVTQSLFGFYLGTTFITNHVGMETLGPDEDLGFLRRQVRSSRNLSGPAFSGFLFGGLDSQIEHHLFPTMPRANLRRARAVVRPFCVERGIPYAEQTPWHAYREVLRHLDTVGRRSVAPD